MPLTQTEQEALMDQVIDLACQNLKRPFASLIVDNRTGEVLASGLNKNYKNPVLHSELMAITDAIDNHPRIDWKNTILFTTAEPSPMGMTAILWTGIPSVVYGTSMDTLSKLDFRQVAIPAKEVIDRAVNLNCQLLPGVREAKCNELFSAASKIDKVQ